MGLNPTTLFSNGIKPFWDTLENPLGRSSESGAPVPFIPRFFSHAFGIGNKLDIDKKPIEGQDGDREWAQSAVNVGAFALILLSRMRDQLPFLNPVFDILEKIPGFSWAGRMLEERPIASRLALGALSPSTAMVEGAMTLGQQAVQEGGAGAIVEVCRDAASGNLNMTAMKTFGLFLARVLGAVGLGFHAQRAHKDLDFGVDNMVFGNLYAPQPVS